MYKRDETFKISTAHHLMTSLFNLDISPLLLQKHIEEVIESTSLEREKYERLYMPGCVMYITETVEKP